MHFFKLKWEKEGRRRIKKNERMTRGRRGGERTRRMKEEGGGKEEEKMECCF